MTTRKQRTKKLDLMGRLEMRLDALEDQFSELILERERQARDWFRWRKAQADLVDLLDHGLRKTEENLEQLSARHVALNDSVGGTNDRVSMLENWGKHVDTDLKRIGGDKQPSELDRALFAEELRAPPSDRAMSKDESLRQRLIEIQARELLRMLTLIGQITASVANP